MAQPSAVIVMALLLCALHQASAVCCKRKASFGCCGNGGCNIFCCNCDNGCNTQCENTHCDTGEWIKCAGVVARCSAACAGSMGVGCATCMGSSYSTCAKCYSNGRRRMLGMTSISTTQDRNTFFSEIAAGDKAITLPRFELWLHNTQGNFTHTAGRLTPDQVFRSYDVNSDGIISRREFDNKDVNIGWRDIRLGA